MVLLTWFLDSIFIIDLPSDLCKLLGLRADKNSEKVIGKICMLISVPVMKSCVNYIRLDNCFGSLSYFYNVLQNTLHGCSSSIYIIVKYHGILDTTFLSGQSSMQWHWYRIHPIDKSKLCAMSVHRNH